MSRAIDRLPTPAHVREKRLIVTGRSRSGTYSLHQALIMLGYRSYHMAEVIPTKHHMEIFNEALHAKYHGIGEPYGKAEFDKWFANYDCLTEIPAFFPEEIIAAYPDAQFIHVDRDPDKWLTSVLNVFGSVEPILDSSVIRVMGLYDSFIKPWRLLHKNLFAVLRHDLKPEDPMTTTVMKDDYLQLTELVKRLVPSEKLAYFSLEDGFGWEEICPVLDKPIPEERYPRGNAPKEFDALMQHFLAPSFRKAIALAVTTVVVPVVGIGAWYYRSRR